MKLLKIFGLLILTILLILFFALPTSFYIKNEILINQKQNIVYEQINVLKNWEKWSPWQAIDPKMSNKYEGPESGVGAINIYKSDNDDVGNGKMQILNSNENFITFGLFFEDMGDGSTPNLKPTFTLTKMSDNVTQVTWIISDTVGYFSPYRIFIPFMDVKMSDVFKDGLERLKKVSESVNEKILDVVLSEGITKKFRLITIRDTSAANTSEIKNNMMLKFRKLVQYMKSNNITGQNIPFTIQRLYDKDKNIAIYEYGLPLDSTIVAKGISKEFNVIEIGGVYSVSATQTGPIKAIEQSHIGIKKYMQLKEYKSNGNFYLYYLTNPDEVGEWGMVTELVYPVIKN